MVRFYKSYLGRMLLGILLLIEIEKKGGKDAVYNMIKDIEVDDKTAAQVANAADIYMNGYGDESPSNEDVLKGAVGQLSKKKTDESDLLDVIVDILRLPFGGFGSSMKSLRDAILNPSELVELRKQIKSLARCCSCGHEFERDEMCSYQNSNGGEVAVYCNKCHRPTYVRCDYCDGVAVLSGKTASTWRNEVDCGCRKRKAAEEAARVAATGGTIILDEVAPVPTAAAAMAAQMRIMRRQAARTTAVPPPPAQGFNWVTNGNVAPDEDPFA